MPLSAAVGFLVSDYQKGQGSVSVYNIPSLSPTLFKKKTIVSLRALKTNWLLQNGGQKYSCVCMCVCVCVSTCMWWGIEPKNRFLQEEPSQLQFWTRFKCSPLVYISTSVAHGSTPKRLDLGRHRVCMCTISYVSWNFKVNIG